MGTPEQVEILQQIDTHLLDAAGNKVSDSAIEGFVITHTLTFTGGKITQWVRDFDMVPIRKSRAAKAAKATDIISLSKATWEKQKTMALGDVNPELFTKFATELGEAFSDRMEVLVNPKDKVPGPTYRGDFAGSMGMLGPIWMGFVNTKVINRQFIKRGNDTVIVTQKYDNHLVDATGMKIKGTENKWFNVTHTLTYEDGIVVKWTQEFLNSRLLACRAKAKAIENDNSLHVRMVKLPIRPGMVAEATSYVQNDLTKGLGFIKGLLGVEIYHMSDTLFVAVARYETKTTMDAAAPKIGKVLGGIKAMLAGKPEVETQRVIWNFDGAGTNNAKAALRIMTIPITSTATEEAVLEIAQGDALQRGMKSLTGLISGEVIFYEGDKMITMTKYASLKQLEAATPKVKSVLAPMKQFMAGPPAPLTGEKIFSHTN